MKDLISNPLDRTIRFSSFFKIVYNLEFNFFI